MNNSLLGITFSAEAGAEPCTLEEAKLFAAIDLEDYDDLVTELIKQARKDCESYVGRSFITRTITAEICSPYGSYMLPYGKVNTITSVKDENDVDVEYKMIGDYLTTLPIEYLKVVYVITTPFAHKVALLNQVKYLFDNRAAADLGLASKNILKRYREVY
jgi:hypothetical protein